MPCVDDQTVAVLARTSAVEAEVPIDPCIWIGYLYVADTLFESGVAASTASTSRPFENFESWITWFVDGPRVRSASLKPAQSGSGAVCHVTSSCWAPMIAPHSVLATTAT